MRGLGLVIAIGLCAAAAAARPQPPAAAAPAASGAEIERFERALGAGDLQTASTAFDALAEAHAAAAPALRPDPLLSGLVGRLYLARGWTAFALAYLRHADDEAVPAAQRIPALIALADAQARSGDRAAALATLRRIGERASVPADRLRAALAAARLTAVSDPAAALAAVRPLLGQGDAAQRFEAEMVAAQAHSLLGDRAAAAAASDRAWAAAAALPAAAAAPVRAAILRAGLAAERGDRDALFAMLNPAGAARAGLTGELVSQLPVCGERGVLASDHVTFGLSGGGLTPVELVPLAASRASIVVPFVDAVHDYELLEVDGPAAGLVVTVRCRSTPAAVTRAPDPRLDWAAWFADRGLYFALSPPPTPAGIDALSRRVGEMENRLGTDHPRLIAARLDLAERIAMSAAVANVDTTEWARLHAEAIAAMRRIGGVERALPSPAGATLSRRLAATRSHEEMVALIRAELPAILAASPPDLAFGQLQYLYGQSRGLPTDLSIALARAVLARFPEGSADPRRRALLIRLGTLLGNAGDASGARAAYRAAGMPAGACTMMDEAPVHSAGTITNEDYPLDAIINLQTGSTSMEYAVAADGSTTARRIIVSAPSLIFDEITDRSFARFTHSAPRSGGRARSCFGLVRSVRWELPQAAEEIGPRRPQPPSPGDRI